MKNIIKALIAVVVLVSYSCQKAKIEKVTPEEPTMSKATSISGKWNVVSSSMTLTSRNSNIAPFERNYRGTSGDYYDFNADGNLYWKEGEISHTVKYTVTDKSITFSFDGKEVDKLDITANSANSLILKVNKELEFGQSYTKEIVLSR